MKPKRLGSALIAILFFENGFLNLNKMTNQLKLLISYNVMYVVK